MCTVACVPLPGGYLLGHNRDERWRRARGRPPRLYRRGSRAFLAPRDPEGGGTWIAVNDAGWSFCILNAAPGTRAPRRPVRSRGRLVWAIAHSRGAGAALELLRRENLAHLRPFELLAVGPPRAPRILRLAWDGQTLRVRWIDAARPRLFVASSLGAQGLASSRRRRWYRLLSATARPDPRALAAWLASHGKAGPGPQSVCMHDSRAGTVSRTLVQVGRTAVLMRYREGPPCRPDAREWIRRLALRHAR